MSLRNVEEGHGVAGHDVLGVDVADLLRAGEMLGHGLAAMLGVAGPLLDGTGIDVGGQPTTYGIWPDALDGCGTELGLNNGDVATGMVGTSMAEPGPTKNESMSRWENVSRRLASGTALVEGARLNDDMLQPQQQRLGKRLERIILARLVDGFGVGGSVVVYPC